jgi:hypothetical protein
MWVLKESKFLIGEGLVKTREFISVIADTFPPSPISLLTGSSQTQIKIATPAK